MSPSKERSESYRVLMKASSKTRLEVAYREWKEQGGQGHREAFLLDAIEALKRAPPFRLRDVGALG